MRLLNLHFPHLMLILYHGIIPKVVSLWFTILNWGRGGDEVCSVNVHQLSNLGWLISSVMSKIAFLKWHLHCSHFETLAMLNIGGTYPDLPVFYAPAINIIYY